MWVAFSGLTLRTCLRRAGVGSLIEKMLLSGSSRFWILLRFAYGPLVWTPVISAEPGQRPPEVERVSGVSAGISNPVNRCRGISRGTVVDPSRRWGVDSFPRPSRGIEVKQEKFLMCESCCGKGKVYAVGYDCHVAGTTCGECKGKGFKRAFVYLSPPPVQTPPARRPLVRIDDQPRSQFMIGSALIVVQTLLWWWLF